MSNMLTLPPGLAHLATIPQAILYKVVQVPGEVKPRKLPLHPQTLKAVDAHAPTSWVDLPTACARVAELGPPHLVGFSLQPGNGLFFIDIDNCLQADGTWSPLAQEICARFPGAYIEVSQSGKGLHIIARGSAPPHACKNVPLGIELYTEYRGIALTGWHATGDASTDHTAALAALVADYFPQRAGDGLPDGAWTDGPRPGWNDPADDAELIRQALRNRTAKFGITQVTFRDLWDGNAEVLSEAYPDPVRGYDASSVDAALAWQLLRLTGGNCERTARLMRQSALVREKWERHDYLPRTILSAAARQRDVLQNKTGGSGTPAPSTQQVPHGVLTTLEPTDLQHILAPELSDLALSAAFVTQGGQENLRWSPGMGWMVNDVTHWTPDDKLRRYVLAQNVCKYAAGLVSNESEAKRIASARTVNAVVQMAQADEALVLPASAWNNDPMVINTPGGIVDLSTGTTRARSGLDYVTQAARVTPESIPCPTWERFLQRVFVGDMELIEFMRRSMGYWLTGDRREQVLFFLYGLGANGKSVLMELLQWLSGSYAIKLPASALMQSRGERHPTELAQLRGKRLAVSSELDESSYFNESLIKELTGDNTLTARFMRGDFFEFAMSQKHVIVGNFKPRLRGGDPAMARRMLLVPFNASFKGSDRDPQMLDKLKAEAPGILAWIVSGAVDWSRSGLAIPASVRGASAEYMSDHDDLQLWMDECCLREGEGKAADLYASFGRWKKLRGEHAPSQTVWGSRITTLPGISKRKSSGIYYLGLRLTIDETRRINGGF